MFYPSVLDLHEKRCSFKIWSPELRNCGGTVFINVNAQTDRMREGLFVPFIYFVFQLVMDTSTVLDFVELSGA